MPDQETFARFLAPLVIAQIQTAVTAAGQRVEQGSH